MHISIRDFRAAYHLDETWGVRAFEPKDFTGLGSIEKAGSDLHRVQKILLEAVPERIYLREILTVCDTLRDVFSDALSRINEQVGLREFEQEFAVAGLHAVLTAYGFALYQAKARQTPLPSFETVYQQWLDSTQHLTLTAHAYPYQGQIWQVQVLNYAYGRWGLRVAIGHGIVDVEDRVFACPAEGWMKTTLSELCAALVTRLQTTS